MLCGLIESLALLLSYGDCCLRTAILSKKNATNSITPSTPHSPQRIRCPYCPYTQVPPTGASTNATENAALNRPMYCPRFSTGLRRATKLSNSGVVSISPHVHTNTVTARDQGVVPSGNSANPAHRRNAPMPMTRNVSKRSTTCRTGIWHTTITNVFKVKTKPIV